MALTSGTRVGHYEIVDLLGAGGMGEVYRARDLRLQRTVAVKLLPGPFAQDPDRVARFEREAQTLAALNHPHIAQVHGLEPMGASSALVMELVEGQGLDERIAARVGDLPRVPLDETLAIARQIADALEAAHDHGIVHRDLKPANIRVRPDGVVKILDFGLAKAIDVEAGASALQAITTPAMTRTGIILGTAAYMSPEQTRGKPVDKRADIWAFGCVLFEMLTGRRAFDGETVTDTLAAVVTKDPVWTALPAGTPARVVDLLKRCLTKDPRQRLRDIGEARIALDQATTEPRPAAYTPTVPQRPVRASPWSAAAVVTGIAVAAFLGGRGTSPTGTDTPAIASQFSILLPRQTEFQSATRQAFAVSDDGRRLVASLASPSGLAQLWLREVSGTQWSPVSGSDHMSTAAFSPDGRRLAGATVTGEVSVFDTLGSMPRSVGRINGTPVGLAWMPGDILLVGNQLGGPLQALSLSGGGPRPVTVLAAGERRHLFPVAMPDGEHFLYVAFNQEVTRGTVYYASLAGADTQRLYEGGLSRVAFAEPDTLLVAEEGQLGVATLLARRFDPSTGGVTAPPVELLRDIGVGVVVDRAGSLIVPEAGLRRYRFAWHEPTGVAHPVPGGDASVFTFDVSPDGSRLVYVQNFVGLFVRDLERGVSTRLLNIETGVADPVWSPDGRQIAYAFNHGERQGVAAIAADGGAERVLHDSSPVRTFIDDWSSDGRYLAGHQRRSDSRGVIIPVGDARAAPIVFATVTRGRGIDEPHFSPDVRWLAYNANEGASDQVFIVPVPPTGERIQVSTEGGAQPRWSRDGRSLYFLAPNGDLMRVSVAGDGTRLRLSAPARVFATGIPVRSDIDQYAVGPDGRFLLRLPADDDAPQQLRVLHNWRAFLETTASRP